MWNPTADCPSLEGKVALVTGGSRGLGRQMVLAFARAGADVIVASRKQSTCDEVAAEASKLGHRALGVACHVGHWDDVERLADQAYAEFGRLDVLVNNAGMAPLFPSLAEVSEELFDKVVAVNFKGPFRLTALVGERMHAGAGGSVINISSTASLGPSPWALPYSGAKAALNMLTQGFSAAFSPNVRVNTIVIGPFATDVAEHWADPPDHDHPGWTKAGLRVGQPDEMVGLAVYLASDASSFTNAATIRVDGGPVRATRGPVVSSARP